MVFTKPLCDDISSSELGAIGMAFFLLLFFCLATTKTGSATFPPASYILVCLFLAV
ncbi:hypothetical protein AVEN_259664-1, partial [Araneus ventricosus]